MFKIIDRYIFKNIFSAFWFGLFIFTSIFFIDLLMELIDFVINKGVPIWMVTKLFLFSLPSILILTIPMATLLSVLVAFGKLSADKEVVAMLGCGVSYYRILRPAWIFGVIMTLTIIIFNEFVIPVSNVKRRVLFRKIMFQKPIPKIAQNVFFNGEGGKTFFIRKYDSKSQKLKDLIVFEKKVNDFPALIIAKKGYWKDYIWYLEDGVKLDFNLKKEEANKLFFQQMKIYSENRYKSFSNYSSKRASDMSLRELAKKIEKMKAKKIKTRDLEMEFYFKTSIPFAALCFVLIGAPLAINTQRSSKSIGVGLSILLIFFYYFLMSIGKALGKGGLIHPALAMWFQNIAIVIIAIIIMKKARK